MSWGWYGDLVVNFIISPGALLDGYTPQSAPLPPPAPTPGRTSRLRLLAQLLTLTRRGRRAGFETLAFEWFGISCAVFGISLIVCGKAMQLPNLIWQLAWLASLGSLFAGVAWRPESALADAAWASGPVAAHSVFFISAVLALNLEPAESADEGRKAD